MPMESMFPDLLGLPSQIEQTLFGASETQMQYLSMDMGTTATRRTSTASTTESPVTFFPSTDEAAKCNLTPGGSGENFKDDLQFYKLKNIRHSSDHSISTFSLVALLLSIFNIVTLLVQVLHYSICQPRCQPHNLITVNRSSKNFPHRMSMSTITTTIVMTTSTQATPTARAAQRATPTQASWQLRR